MIDRLVDHADVIALKGDSYRLMAAISAATRARPTGTDQQQSRWPHFGRHDWPSPQPALT
jgi:hypothetical protein